MTGGTGVVLSVRPGTGVGVAPSSMDMKIFPALTIKTRNTATMITMIKVAAISMIKRAVWFLFESTRSPCYPYCGDELA